MTVSLLASKLFVPPARPGLVPRSRLTERLNAGLERDGRFVRRLSLVCAPAGYGKTTLVSTWLDTLQHPHAWLALDEGDNDPIRFDAYLVAAMQLIDADIGQAARETSPTSQPSPTEEFLTSLLNDIAVTPRPFVLVLDDYHLIHTPSVHQQLAFLVEHQPPQMHLAIATREEPPLPLSRLRARGQVVDIRQADLQFTRTETAAFLEKTVALGLSQANVAALYQRTEGWIAGLHLAALSLRGIQDVERFVQRFAGDQRYVLDYLMDEVFEQQPAHVREFLLQTSILDRFSASLCGAVCGAVCNVVNDLTTEQPNSRQILRTLEETNLFVVPLDSSRQWYRYHRLFADLLRHRLEIEPTYDPALLHKRASQWYAGHGFVIDAIAHALAASDWTSAADLIVDTADSLLKQGEVVTLLHWFDLLPDQILRTHPRLCLELSWPLILSEQIDRAESCLAYAEQAVQEDDSLLGEVALVQAHIARVRGNAERAIELSERALQLSDDLSVRSIAAVNVGMAQWYRGHLAEAEEALSEAQRTGQGSGNEYARWTGYVFLNRIRVARGQLREAAAAHRHMIQQGERLPLIALAHYDLGRLHYEWNELEAAAKHLVQGLEQSRRSRRPELEIGGYATLAAIKHAQNDAAAAQDALVQVDRLLDHADISPATYLYCLAFRILGALAQNDLPTAMLTANKAPGPEEIRSFPDYLWLMGAQTRLLLHQARRKAAADKAAALHGMACQAGWRRIAIQARALQALAAPSSQDALVYLADALVLAEPEGYIRTFVDLGTPMAALLYQTVAQGIHANYARELLAAFDAASVSPSVQPPIRRTLVEPLSERELEILRLLADRLTYDEIARALYLSVNTVKTHVQNIYGKLGVNRRRAATARARELGLLP